MAKKEMILSQKEISENLYASDAAKSCYQFALDNAGLEMDDAAKADFVVKRNAKTGWRDLWELKAWCEKTASSIKDILKHTFNEGTEEELPDYVKWAKQSFTYDFKEGAGAIVAESLVKKHLCNREDFLSQLTVSQVVKASGLSVDKIMSLFPDIIIEKPKERTLSIK